MSDVAHVTVYENLQSPVLQPSQNRTSYLTSFPPNLSSTFSPRCQTLGTSVFSRIFLSSSLLYPLHSCNSSASLFLFSAIMDRAYANDLSIITEIHWYFLNLSPMAAGHSYNIPTVFGVFSHALLLRSRILLLPLPTSSLFPVPSPSHCQMQVFSRSTHPSSIAIALLTFFSTNANKQTNKT